MSSRGRTFPLNQGIAGLAYSLSPDVDLFADYRYRSNTNDGNYADAPSRLWGRSKWVR